MIEIQNLCAGYAGLEVLHNFSTSFKEGKVTVIVGPNGCGKSTLLKSMIRLNPAVSGHILLDGQNIDELTNSMLAQKIAYISQSRKTPDISVRRMVLHGRFPYLKYPRRYRAEDYAVADQAMSWVGIDDLAEKNVSELSGGTQQKVYIAMALAQDTPAILMDEPTVFLDISHQLKTLKMAKKLAEIAEIDLDELAMEMFNAGSSLKGKSAEEICFQDFKQFKVNDVVFGVGQINSMNPEELMEAKELLKPHLPKVMRKNGLQMVFFMLTDILNESSELLCCGNGARKCIQDAYDIPEEKEKVLLKGVVSRKKQLIPALVSTLQQ